MTKLGIIWATLSITKNPLAGLALKRSNTRKAIAFKNGCTYRLTWPQFRYLRGSYPVFSKFTLTQLEDDLFKLDSPEGIITCSSALLFLICNLMQNYTVTQEKTNLFRLKNDKVELVGFPDMLVCIQELETGEYEWDYRDKVVLDVGGFEGESAAYFWQKGAKKVIIYEPLAEHVKFIERNVALNHINAEIHQKGIGKTDGRVTIHFDRIDPGFGINSTGSSSVEIEVSDVSKVIAGSSADIAKFDCEGAEEFLVGVPSEILGRIPFYIIEVHSTDIRKSILEKFEDVGFTLKKEIAKHSNFSVLVFQRAKK